MSEDSSASKKPESGSEAPKASPAPEAQAPASTPNPAQVVEKKKSSAGKVILGIVGGCVILGIVFAVLAFFGFSKAIDKAEELQDDGYYNDFDYGYDTRTDGYFDEGVGTTTEETTGTSDDTMTEAERKAQEELEREIEKAFEDAFRELE